MGPPRGAENGAMTSLRDEGVGDGGMDGSNEEGMRHWMNFVDGDACLGVY